MFITHKKPSTSWGRSLTRRTAGAAITAIVAATLAAGAVTPAYASLGGPVGLIDGTNGFPISFSDGNVKLAQCLSGPQCIGVPPNAGAVDFPNNFPDEWFYFIADASGGNLRTYRAALEAAFVNGVVADQEQMGFNRLRFLLENLVTGASYTITHPYGVHTFSAVADAGNPGFGLINQTIDAGKCAPLPGAPCNWASVGAGFLGNAAGATDGFLTQTNQAVGFIGDITAPGLVTGAPSGTNAVVVTGPNAGGPGVDILTVNQFTVQGKLLGNPTAPSAPLAPTATAGKLSALVRWSAPGNGGLPITKYVVRIFNATTGAPFNQRLVNPAVGTSTNSMVFTGLPVGISVRAAVQATNAAGTGPLSVTSNGVRPMSTPGAPIIRPAAYGAVGGAITATANWLPPVSNGGNAINGYVVTALRMNPGGPVLRRTDSVVQHFSRRSLSMTLPAGSYRFVVRARNGWGLGVATSATSNMVIAR